VNGVLGVNADTRLPDLVAADIRQERALNGIGQSEVYVVILGLDAERGLHQPPGKGAVQRSRGIQTGHDAVVVLMKLVAQRRICQEIGEIVEEIEFAFDHIDTALPRSGIVGRCYSR
jgi:hypothetical protein